MVITTTAVAFILLSLGLGVCGFWFWKAFQKSGGNSKIGILLSSFIFASSFQNGIIGLGALIFSTNPEGLYSILLISQVFLLIHALLGIYVVYYIFFPQKSSLLAMSVLGSFGLIMIFMTIREYPLGVITPQNSIFWPASFILSLITFLVLLVSIGSFFYIFARLFLDSKTKDTRIIALVLSILALGGIVSTFFRFVGTYASSENRHLLDISMGITGLLFIIVLMIIPTIQKLRNDKSKEIHIKKA